ncbi:MAG: septum formation protein Maf [Planctomycetia bacterium]|nr:septum formation protein Maf [Planctomycetia bacterium]
MGNPSPVRLILASGSSARRDLLTQAGYAFEVLPANIDEPTEVGALGIRGFVQQVAWLKAAAVAPQVEEGIVLAADTVGWLDGQVIGKPADAADARRILRQLGGTTHELWTGAVLWRRPDDVQCCWQEVSRVRFKQLTDEEIDAYLATRQWVGCSGAYAVQEGEDPYVKVVEGSVSNVIGLPMETLERLLRTVVASSLKSS